MMLGMGIMIQATVIPRYTMFLTKSNFPCFLSVHSLYRNQNDLLKGKSNQFNVALESSMIPLQ